MELTYIFLSIYGSLIFYIYINYLLRKYFYPTTFDNDLNANNTNQINNPIRNCTIPQ